MTAPIANWIDWADLPIVLAVARTGSLSAAAGQLGLSQPTVGRRLAACEARLGERLTIRGSRGVELTSAGRSLLNLAETLNHQLLGAEPSLTSSHSRVQGKVRLTASEWLCDRIIGKVVGRFLMAHPAVFVEVVAGAQWLNLPRREADVAIRPARFRHNSVYQRKLARVTFALYAAPAYLAVHGPPDWSRRLEGHRLALMSTRPGQPIADVEWLSRVASRATIVCRCNGRDALAEMATSGAAIVCLPRFVGDASTALRRIDQAPEPPSRMLHLGTSRDSRDLPRVRALVAILRETFADLAPTLAPL